MKTTIKIELELEIELDVDNDLEFDKFVMNNKELLEELAYAAKEESYLKSNYERFRREAGYE